MIRLDGGSLTLEQVAQVIYSNEQVEIRDEAWAKIKRSRAVIDSIVEQGQKVYGVTTGFGKFSDTVISAKDAEKLQINLIRSHACAVGEPLPRDTVRTMLLLRANALAKGYSGITASTLKLLVDVLNAMIVPLIPSQGSLGASGDLAPLSHLALLLVGEGEVLYQGERLSGAEALHRAGLKPVTLKAKEGLALINGTQAMTAIGVMAYLDAQRLALLADGIAALTLEALRGITDVFAPDSHLVRPYPEQRLVAGRILGILKGSSLTTVQGQIRTQDAYSLRCIPQVHGAVQQVLTYVREKLLIEINSATDNPLVFPDSGQVISGGNFHGQPIAFAMDFLGIGMAEIASISERRIERLVNPQLNDLPAFLSPDPGLQSGMMITQYTAASLVSENKTLAHPASVDSIPSSANQEDHVSMGTTAARQAAVIVDNGYKVLAIEAICAAQAAEIRGAERLAPATRKLLSLIRSVVPPLTEDRSMSGDIERLACSMKTQGWSLEEIQS
ncbi:histidine ammonia-lyase [Paenibacillus sophorae]|uniref:Histidine ammonia-lyase n=1 Tax=Paenibacillus sophorae TaxID=1333845 RepID=A0A1H8FHJ0_9BACL|nr:histidine ammonia-lyase [Paenibacillus sophorae]QWU13876.1 histidine ammonia-lyase [Paenibacillus sophorae]SEN31321.1 histidine ammonia-lyase [Paenibacillus sophorae]